MHILKDTAIGISFIISKVLWKFDEVESAFYFYFIFYSLAEVSHISHYVMKFAQVRRFPPGGALRFERKACPDFTSLS